LCLWQQRPARNRDGQKAAVRSREQYSRPARVVRLSQFLEIGITRAARAKVIEPLLRFRKRQFMRGDPLKNVIPRISDALTIRELFEQTAAQRVQNAPFIPLRISLSPIDASLISWLCQLSIGE
jgi:hypothetical protein